MDICGSEVILGDIKHDVGLLETKIVFQLVTDVDEKSEVRRCIEEKTPDSVWSVPSNLSLLPSQRGKTNVLLDGHRYHLHRKGKLYDQWRCAQYKKKKKSPEMFGFAVFNQGVGAFDVYLMQTVGKKCKRDNGSQQTKKDVTLIKCQMFSPFQGKEQIKS